MELIDIAIDIVKSCSLLHNFVRQNCGINFKDMLKITGLEKNPLIPELECLVRTICKGKQTNLQTTSIVMRVKFLGKIDKSDLSTAIHLHLA